MSPPSLKIANTVIERINSVKKTCSGCLFGVIYDNTLLILGFNIEQKFENAIAPDIIEWKKRTHKHILYSLPTEVDLCGIIAFGNDIDDERTKEVLTKMLEHVDITDNPLLLSCHMKPGAGAKAHFYLHEKLLPASYEVVDEFDIWREFLHVRVQGKLPLTCQMDLPEMKDALNTLHKKVAGGMLSFCFQKSNVYLMGSDSETGLSGLSGDPSVEELWEISCDDANLTEGCSRRAKRRNISSQAREIDVLTVNLLTRPTADRCSHSERRTAPIMQHTKKVYDCLVMKVNVDALSMVSRKTKVLDLYGILVESVCRNIILTEQSLLEQLKVNSASGNGRIAPSYPETFHFLPPNISHFLTLLYPRNKSDGQLGDFREEVHNQLALPNNKPYFRRTNAHLFRDDLPANSPLVNPHEGLGPSGVKDGEVSIVQGLYTYHHYMQDKMDDDGWGCAYRSLQTLVSWFRWQGYTDHPIPTHHEIQKCLVDVKDKPASFIGSTQWIGSTEVYMCLESMLGVTCRILSVSSGEELGSKGGELTLHFETQGTPVMIGGGVLAHTILGVDFNKRTGDLKFLVLDPHYTGGEDITIVQSKGWCGWKGVNFWSKSAYYNLCMPIRPVCI